MLVSCIIPIGRSQALDSAPSVKEFVHTVEVNEYGLTTLTCTISFYNNLSSNTIVPSIKIGYPKEFYEKMVVAEVSDRRFNPSLSVEGNLTVASLAPEGNVEVASGSEYNLTVKFLVKNLFSFPSSNVIQLILPVYPSLNFDSRAVLSNIIVPYGVTLSTSLENFTYTMLATKNIYTRTFENVKAGDYLFKNVSAELMSGTNLYLLEVPRAVRTLQFYDDGSIWVTEELQLKNLGKTNITTLSLNILNDRILSVKLVQAVGPEVDYDLGLYRQFTLPHPLNYNETYTLKIRYPAPSNLTKLSGNNYIVNITAKPPLNVLVKEYVLEAKFSQGFIPLSGEQAKVFENSSPLSQERFVVEYTPKLYWSASTYIPTALLIIALFAFLTPFLQSEAGEERRYALDLRENVKSKLKLVESTIELYEGRLEGRIPKQRFNILKQEYLSSLTKVNSSVANASTEALRNEPQKKPVIDKISSANREIDTLLKQLTSYYDQLNIGKIDRKEFEKRRSDAIKRINMLKQEIESELEKI